MKAIIKVVVDLIGPRSHEYRFQGIATHRPKDICGSFIDEPDANSGTFYYNVRMFELIITLPNHGNRGYAVILWFKRCWQPASRLIFDNDDHLTLEKYLSYYWRSDIIQFRVMQPSFEFS